ncbi:hypothetical protein [Corynebacterium sp. 335C]
MTTQHPDRPDATAAPSDGTAAPADAPGAAPAVPADAQEPATAGAAGGTDAPAPLTRAEARDNARRARRAHQEPTFSGAAGTVLVAGIAVAVVFGILLGVLRPGQSVDVLPGGAAAVRKEDMAAGFTGLIIAATLSGIAGLGLGAWSWARHRRWRGAGMLVVAGLVAAVTSLGIITVGDVIGLLRQGDASTAAAGDVVTLIPPIPQLVPALIAAFLALLAYWSGVLLAGDGGEEAVETGVDG